MDYAPCCTKPSVALAHFIVSCISNQTNTAYEHYEKTRNYLGSARVC